MELRVGSLPQKIIPIQQNDLSRNPSCCLDKNRYVNEENFDYLKQEDFNQKDSTDDDEEIEIEENPLSFFSDDDLVPPTQLPNNFSDLVQQLVELGFPEDKAKNTLIMTYFNFDRALDLLLNNENPTRPVPYHYDEYEHSYSILQTPYAKSLNSSERENLLLIQKQYPQLDPEIIIQVFDACDKDPQLTISCINETM